MRGGIARRARSRSRTGTFSHLCASVAQESARSCPVDEVPERGARAAQSPNAPSTCSHAPERLARRPRSRGSRRTSRCSPRRPGRRRSSARRSRRGRARGAPRRIRPSSSVGTSRDLRGTDPEVGGARGRRSTWRLLARRRPRAAARPARPCSPTLQPARVEHRVARDREAGRVRHLAAGDEGERRVAREPEQLLDPRPGEFSSTTAAVGVEDEQAGVLVPRRDEPVGGQRGGKRPPDHEAEVPAEPIAVSPAPSRTSARSRRRSGRARLGKRAVERLAQLAMLARGADRPLSERLDPVRRELRGPARGALARSCARVYDARLAPQRERRRGGEPEDRRARSARASAGAPTGSSSRASPRFTSCSFQASWARLTAP